MVPKPDWNNGQHTSKPPHENHSNKTLKSKGQIRALCVKSLRAPKRHHLGCYWALLETE